eukprot:2698315-Prymnesium_polylepis.1
MWSTSGAHSEHRGAPFWEFGSECVFTIFGYWEHGSTKLEGRAENLLATISARRRRNGAQCVNTDLDTFCFILASRRCGEIHKSAPVFRSSEEGFVPCVSN